ncbi:MAG: hypothetical protein OCU22_05545 [Canidatus Methanoxibalbensis ujae]|nr:hypothetical protein [Candidatus Methanoxibalbensis ujae]
MKKILIVSCVIVALSSVVLVNQWINVGDNDSKNTIKFNSKLSSEFNKVVDIALADCVFLPSLQRGASSWVPASQRRLARDHRLCGNMEYRSPLNRLRGPAPVSSVLFHSTSRYVISQRVIPR